MKIFIIIVAVLLVIVSVSVGAQNNDNGITDIESNRQLALNTTNFVKVSTDFTQTPYFPLLLGLTPYAAPVVVGVPWVLAGIPQVASFGLLGLANPDYLATLRTLEGITASAYDISASIAAFTLPIGLILSYVVNIQYLYFGNETYDVWGVIGFELLNTTLYYILGFVWVDGINRFASNTNSDLEVDVFVDGITVGAITAAVYLATSIAKGIIWSTERGTEPILLQGETTTDWRVQPSLNGVEVVYSY